MKKTFSFMAVALIAGFFQGYAQQRPDPYDFPVKPGTEHWNTLRSYQEKRDACNIPENRLLKMSTQALIETYVQYPLLGDVAVFRTWQEGVDKLRENFNGAGELLRRPDAGKFLLEYYKSMDGRNLNPAWSAVEKGKYSFQLMAIEVLLAQDDVLATLSNTHKKELLKISVENLKRKKANPEVYGSFSFTSTGWMMARILRNSNFQPFMESYQLREHYKQFVNEGLALDTSLVEDVNNQAQVFLTKR